MEITSGNIKTCRKILLYLLILVVCFIRSNNQLVTGDPRLRRVVKTISNVAVQNREKFVELLCKEFQCKFNKLFQVDNFLQNLTNYLNSAMI